MERELNLVNRDAQIEIQIRGLLSTLLAALLSELETNLHPLNTAAISEMAEKMKQHIAAA
jgi:hypothetical protein